MNAMDRMEIVNPVARVSEGEKAAAGKSVASLEGLTVGLLDNGMPHAGDFLNHVGEALSKRYGAKLLLRKKAFTARSAGKEMLDEFAGSCQVAVTGFGI
jgi:hypothetical protein